MITERQALEKMKEIRRNSIKDKKVYQEESQDILNNRMNWMSFW